MSEALSIKENLITVRQAIKRCTSNPVRIVAVSKKQSVDKMLAYIKACKELGEEIIFGESYVQEFEEKREFIPEGEIHLIGRLQSNKIKDAVRLFDLIQSIGTKELAYKVAAEAERQNKVQRVLLQVNVSADDDKNGFTPEEARDFFYEEIKAVSVEGLMTITRQYERVEAVRADYKAMKKLSEEIEKRGFKNTTCIISMGMSADFEIAVQEGAAMVRVGTLIFGERE